MAKVKKKGSSKTEVKKKFQIFIWNSKIHNTFLLMLVFLVFLLIGVTYVQNLYIKQLNYKIANPVEDALDYTYDIMTLEDFVESRNLEKGALSDIYKYFLENEYTDIFLKVGFVEGSTLECVDGVCSKITYRFNQNKGLYVDIISQRIGK